MRKELAAALDWGKAHADFDRAVERFPPKLRGRTVRGLPYSAWQILEHIRLAQHDLLDFATNPRYAPMTWPDDYWPKEDAPESPAALAKSLEQFRTDLQAMEALVEDPKTELFAKIPWGNGQTILREAMLVADHNAYHLGQLVLVRQLLGQWPAP